MTLPLVIRGIVDITNYEQTSKFNVYSSNDRFKHLDSQYIYLISYRNAKKANPANGFAFF
jgi:hypothetical protein